MDSAQELATAVEPLVPLRVRDIEYQDSALVLIGDEWSLALLYGWVWRNGASVVTEWSDDLAADLVWDLIGLDVIRVRPAGRKDDCAFELSDRSRIEVTPDSAGYEAWTFRHDRLDLSFVGTG